MAAHEENEFKPLTLHVLKVVLVPSSTLDRGESCITYVLPASPKFDEPGNRRTSQPGSGGFLLYVQWM
jgi:hypothetical protein